jgi:hypothetical protein
MAKPIIASKVVVEVKLSPCLKLINEPEQENGCVLRKPFGNVTTETKKFSFEYALKDKEELVKLPQVNWFDP